MSDDVRSVIDSFRTVDNGWSGFCNPNAAPPCEYDVPIRVEYAAGHQRAGTTPDASPFAGYSPPPSWRDVALFVGAFACAASLVWTGLRRLVKR